MYDIIQAIQDGTFKLSISRLKKLHPDDCSEFLKFQERETPSMSIGHIFESKIKGLPLPDKYEVMDKTCSEAITNILTLISQNTESDDLENCKELVLRCARSLEYNSNYKDDTLVDAILKYNHVYKVLRSGKIIVNQSMISISDTMSKYIVENELFPEYVLKSENSLFLDNLYLESILDNVLCQAYLDRVIINTEAKKISVLDFKSTTRRPLEAARQDRWDLQGSFYKELFEELRRYGIAYMNGNLKIAEEKAFNKETIQILDQILKFFNEKEILISDFRYYSIEVVFMVGRSNSPKNPILIVMSDVDFQISIMGSVNNELPSDRKLGLKDYFTLYKKYVNNGFKSAGKVQGIWNTKLD